MPHSFPLPLDLFAEAGRVRQMPFRLGEAMSSSETGEGQILRGVTGTRLWQGQFVFAGGRVRQQEAFEALIDILRQPGGSFLVGDWASRYPRTDPFGGALFAAAPAIAAVNADRRQLRLKGVPPGHAISDGDHLSILFGSGRYSYHRVVSGSTATPGGLASADVVPLLPLTLTVDDEVHLVRPRMKAVIAPGSHDGGARLPSGRIAGSSFDWVQTLR